MSFNKKKYIVVFLTQEQSTYSVLKIKKFNPSIDTVKYLKNTYPINVSIPTYTRLLKLYYFIDIKEGQISFNKNNNKSLISPEIIDLIVSRKIIHQLTSNLTDTAIKMNLMMIIIGATIGGLLGWIIGGAG